MLKKMIEERMAQIERSMGNGKPNDKLVDRLVSLEKENKALKEYAKRVEDSVKNILNAEKEKAKLKVTQAVQTQDPSWVSLRSCNLLVKSCSVPLSLIWTQERKSHLTLRVLSY